MNNINKKTARTWLKRLAMCILMTAAAVILDGFLKVPVNLFGIYALKLSFGMVLIIFLSIRFGPLYGGFFGMITDVVQFVIFPVGEYNPLITIGAFVMGCIPGLFFIKDKRIGKLRLFCSVLTGQVVGAVVLNTVFLVISYDLPWDIIITRALSQGILIPIYSFFIYLLLAMDAKYAEITAPHA